MIGKRRHFYKVYSVVVLIAASLMSTPVFAAEAGPAKAPEGIGILILLLGVSAIGFVGLTLIGRMMPVRTGNVMEDDELIKD
jgi:hypothetical protein